MIAARSVDALRLIDQGAREGVAGVLITLIAIEGTSSRAIGTQMAVLADGRQIGSFSGGCVERAIASEAHEVLAHGHPRTVRYGIGSPYIDVRLPCGGGIDLLFTPRPDPALVAQALAQLGRRQPAQLRLGHHVQRYTPALRLVALGHGEDLLALVRLARAFDIDVIGFAPEADLPTDPGIAPLTGNTRLPGFDSDPWTAIVFVFHDRDWEDNLLPQALERPAFYHGAVGSRRTHHARLERLRAKGVPETHIDRLRETVGLIPATRHPATLALSILAELVQDYDATADQRVWHAGMTIHGVTSAA